MNRLSEQTLLLPCMCFLLASGVHVACGQSEVKDVRVSPIVSSQWCLGDFAGGGTFNLYTPNNYPCGCGAVAYGQIMRYWRVPAGPLAPREYQCWLDGNSATYSTMGGTYDWDLMPLTEAECVNDDQRKALGRLTYDIGVASHVSWGSTYSHSYMSLSISALQDYFGYAFARTFIANLSGESVLNNDNYKNAILASLDAGMPVVIGLRTTDNRGHQLIVDGYGFDDSGNLLCHLNFGWKGAGDGWYNLMANTFVAEGYEFGQIDEIAYNIHPTETGDVISGRIMDQSGNPVKGITVRLSAKGSSSALLEAVTDEKGIYSFRFTDKGTYVISTEVTEGGYAERKVAITKIGSNVSLSSMNFSVPFNQFALSASSLGSVGNQWGVDLVLGNDNPDPSDDPISPSDPTSTVEPLFTKAATIDGYLKNADNTMGGTIQVKVGKANKKTGQSKLTAIVLNSDVSKKLSFKGVLATDGTAELTCAGQPTMKLSFDKNGMSGETGNYGIVGVRNLFTSKDKAEVSSANATLNPCLGSVNIAWEDTFLTLNIAAKGKIKVSGTSGDKRISARSQIMLGETKHVIPVILKKPKEMMFLVEMSTDGSGVSLPGHEDCEAGRVVGLHQNAAFHVDVSATLWKSLQGKVLIDMLPEGQTVMMVGGKWMVDKAGKVAYKKGTTELDETKLGSNPSALKLTYKSKDGTFKGTFKVYSEVNGKPKATTASVTGVLIGDKGYGAAVIKKVGSVPITVE